MGLYIHTPKPKPQYFGLNNLDQKMEKYLNYDSGFFVELGANNGVDQSNTLYYEKYRNWRGVFVEPTLHNFLECKINRSEATKVYSNACTSFDYKEKFVEIIYSNLMSTPKGLESDIADSYAHANKGAQFLRPKEEIISFGAIAKPLNEILQDAGAPKKIDFLSLDVEGAEIEVLKGINYEEFSFNFMCIECREIDKLSSYLSTKGYVAIDQLTDADYVFTSK